MRVYLDASPVIFYVQGIAGLEQKAASIIESSNNEIYASDLTQLEALVFPVRNNDQRLIRIFEEFFQNQVHEMWQFNSDVFRTATEIRARYNIRTADALHLAVAEINKCELFLTNDLQLRRYPLLNIQIVEQL